jgi:hypothetical protein
MVERIAPPAPRWDQCACCRVECGRVLYRHRGGWPDGEPAQLDGLAADALAVVVRFADGSRSPWWAVCRPCAIDFQAIPMPGALVAAVFYVRAIRTAVDRESRRLACAAPDPETAATWTAEAARVAADLEALGRWVGFERLQVLSRCPLTGRRLLAPAEASHE